MKAAVYDVAGAPGVLKYVDIPDPITGPDDILIALFCAASFMGRGLRGRGHSGCRRIECP